jgi:hypothetical protein
MRAPVRDGEGARPHQGYDPNQPRVPAGRRDGGQWTRTGGSGAPASRRREAVVDRSKQETWGSYVDTYRSDGTLAEQRVFDRDGSRIVSEFNAPGNPGDWDERHTVALSDGSKFRFQTSGDVQEIYDGDGNLISAAVWTKDGPQSLPVGQLADASAGALARVLPGPGRIIAAALTLFAWLAGRKDRDRTPVFAFKAAEYENRGTKKQPDITWVGYVKREELEDVCDKLGDVQKYTDEAVKEVREDNDYKGPADFGTKVHKVIAKKVDDYGDRNFKAEVSWIKSKLEAAYHGEKDSVRIDAFEYRPKISTACVYDPKTGARGLSLPRMGELAQTAYWLFGHKPRHIIVIEVRPGQKR